MSLRHTLIRSVLLPLGLVCLVATAQTTSNASSGSPGASSSRDLQRVQFMAAYAAAKLGGNSWRALGTGLKDYPLYPYLQAAAMQHDMDSVSQAHVEAWLRKYPDLVPAHDLRRDFLHQLAGRKDWHNFRKLYRPGLGYALACHQLTARMASGHKLDFDQDMASIWQQTELPSACDPVLAQARKQGLLTTDRIWQRIVRSLEHGPASTISALAKWLPAGDAAVAERMAQARRSPASALAAADKWSDSLHTRSAVQYALQRMARTDDDKADSYWQTLRHRFAFSTEQQHGIEADIALFNATDFKADSLQRLKQLPAAAQTDVTRAWRVRVALSTSDWKEVLAALDALTPDQQRDEQWRYWRARALAKLNQPQAAEALFKVLAGESNYFGFLAADWVAQPYAVCPLHLAGDAASEQKLLSIGGLDRAFELHALGMNAMARRAWNKAIEGLDADQRRLAANLAGHRGWYDRAIFAFTNGEDLRLYKQRFPIARRQQVLGAAQSVGIDPAWGYAIIRAESAWVTDARSGADARGLMQLLPSTAAQVAKRNKLTYHGAGSLYDPDINIPLGTQYLATMASQYGGAPWLASAAYNAGDSKVNQWLNARRQLPPDVFVATIPYHETRAYVRRVMAFSVLYDWRLNGKVVPLAVRMTPYGQTYAAPTAQSARKQVVCPTPAVDNESAQAGHDATTSKGAGT